ncbi:MAG: hypothetical protein OXU66_07625 [Gammaproteobacteria bacterium]|nr:hypothetical protein [Gammaproteobacteria bacterium]MDD9895858.1 hypothetical protein [Gammaproteobacteria bacterium]MDD9958795.1 hypothetical protein [Gammaproteobacteria bacterium]
MSEEQAVAGNSKIKVLVGGSLAALLAIGIIGFVIYSATCPCERTPGGFLFGASNDAPVTDWTFANDVPLCQLQIYAGIRPHSINLNCMATPEGEMFLSCSVCDTKYWASKVESDEVGIMRLDGVTYPVYVNRITDSATLDRAWRARVAKLQVHQALGNPAPDPNAVRPERWWTFQITSRS